MRDDIYENGTTVRIVGGRMKGKIGKIEQWNQFYEIYSVRVLNSDDVGYVAEEMVMSDNDFVQYESTRLGNVAGSIDVTGTEYITEQVMDSGVNSIKLAVYGNEGLIPHIHFYKDGHDNIGDGSGAICIMEPKYYIHGYHIDKLTEYEMNGIAKFLKSKCLLEDAKGLTNWEYLIESWNESDNVFKIPPNTFIPEYHYEMNSVIENKGNKYGTK